MDEPKIKAQYKTVAILYCGECLGNAEKSAIVAGYSKRYARGNAHKIVAREDIQNYIKYLNSKSKDIRIMKLEELRTFWSKITMDDKEKTIDRLRASELLGKSIGAFSLEGW